MTFTRYAIYFSPPTDAPWAQFATSWLGWDMARGVEVTHPVAEGIDVSAVTDVPRKYGLHATMKPPFHLRQGQTLSELQSACEVLASRLTPIRLDGLEVARLGRFVALRPIGDLSELNNLAAACVQELDEFRHPPSASELDRRRAAGLTPKQDQNLLKWGYPYVLDEFRFHITLSGKLDKSILQIVKTTLDRDLAPMLPVPFQINDLTLVGEAEDGRFHLIHRYALTD
ncbi:DUF1045 domain-containing protein [Ruegeria arenilitoris]|uniref:DUF1045 domain-containing protein n=1 Tax=Ruegeria arenilitoris TaxID=1173585 RepID=UPI00147E118D